MTLVVGITIGVIAWLAYQVLEWVRSHGNR